MGPSAGSRSSASANHASIFGFGAMLTSAGHQPPVVDYSSDDENENFLDDEGNSCPSTKSPQRTGFWARKKLGRMETQEEEAPEPRTPIAAKILIECVSAMDLTPSTAWARTEAEAKAKATASPRKGSPKKIPDGGAEDDASSSSSITAEGSSNPYCVIRNVPPSSSGRRSSSPGNRHAPHSSGRQSSSPTNRRRDADAVLHRTLPVRRDLSPIWTARTRSLYLLELDDTEAFELSGGLEFEVLDGSSGGVLSMMSGGGGAYSHGAARVNPEEILSAEDGARVEFPLTKTRRVAWGEERREVIQTGTLALRFRRATQHDLTFMEAYGKGDKRRTVIETEAVRRGGPADFEFVQEATFRTHGGRKRGGRYAVQPGPDPDGDPKAKYMTEAEIEAASLAPSRKWVTAGTGSHGTLHLEILGCDDLPNLDMGVTGLKGRPNKTDAFCAILFEDTLIRTDVVFDCLAPRWMPWSQRAFAIPVKHPASVLMLGVFDYDCGALNYHDPVGRVVVDPANFNPGTVYDLRYGLRSGPAKDDHCGVIRIRLRIEQPNEKEALLASFGSPARYHVNVDSDKAFCVLRYLSRGPVNMEKASMQTVALLANELLSYFEYYLYVIDYLIGVLLWRGRLDFVIPLPRWVSIRGETEEERRKAPGTGEEASSGQQSAETKGDTDSVRPTKASPSHGIKVSVWFPIQSMIAFEAGVLCVERPSFIPATLFLGVAWIMVTIMHYRSCYPSPWYRCKTVGEITVMLLGKNARATNAIATREGADKAAEFDAIDRAKTERIVHFLMAFKTAALKYKKEYYKTDAEALAIETEVKEWTMFESYLYFVHLGLSYLCIYIRGFRNVIMWKSSSYSYLLTATFFLLGLACALLPMDIVLKWLGRILVWTFLGPWMKLVDIIYVQSYYRTRAELTANPNTKEPEVESLFKGEKYNELAKRVRIAAEDAIKLKHMRECRFGAYCVRVPPFDESRFPSEPLPESTAEPFLAKNEKESVIGDEGGTQCVFVPGQRLHGSMVPITEDLSNSNDVKS